MKKKRECKIIQDLLPNYVENLTNEETNKFIDEHLTDCEDCNNITCCDYIFSFCNKEFCDFFKLG